MAAPQSAIGILMHEHQLILRMIDQMRLRADRLAAGEPLDPVLIPVVVDFIRSYADRCHHGKEEEILFRDLRGKPLSETDAAAMQQLIDDHVWARGKTRELVEASEWYFGGDEEQLPRVANILRQLAEFYPDHIDREDRDFFRKAVGYLTAEERAAMDAECRDFDRQLIHERYREVVEGVERQASS
jgi:hemerythrin-like domain-containing protein